MTISALSLVNGKFDVALEVMQLCLKLFPVESREELYRLLRFMSLAAHPKHIQLHKEVRMCNVVFVIIVGPLYFLECNSLFGYLIFEL